MNKLSILVLHAISLPTGTTLVVYIISVFIFFCGSSLLFSHTTFFSFLSPTFLTLSLSLCFVSFFVVQVMPNSSFFFLAAIRSLIVCPPLSFPVSRLLLPAPSFHEIRGNGWNCGMSTWLADFHVETLKLKF